MEGEFKDYPTVKMEQVSVYITKHSATSEKKMATQLHSGNDCIIVPLNKIHSRLIIAAHW